MVEVSDGPAPRAAADLAGLDDAMIVQRLRDRDERTFAALVPAWSPVMIRVALGYVGSRATAEEVVQETWLAVVKGLDGFEGRSSLRTWVLRICANVARRHGVRDSRVLPVGLTAEDYRPTVDPSRFRAPDDQYPGGWVHGQAPAAWGPEARAMNAEVRQELTAALRELPLRQAQVVALRDVHGLDSAEIAELLDTTEGNIRVLLHRGRVMLRQRLDDYYGKGVVPT